MTDPIHPASGDLEAAIKAVDAAIHENWPNARDMALGVLAVAQASLRPADPVIPTEIPAVVSCQACAGEIQGWTCQSCGQTFTEVNGRLVVERAPAVVGEGVPFQARVLPWLMECFGAEIAADREERCDRFIEEALEQVQSLGWAKERALALVDYVYGRSAGDPHQEAGGVMVTFAALCQAVNLDMAKAGDDELARIMQPEIVAKIRAKQAAKPTGSALPIVTSPPAHDPALIARVREVLGHARVALPSPGARRGKFAEVRTEIDALLADLGAGVGR